MASWSAQFQYSSPSPLRGGSDTGRHIYLALKIPSGTSAGIYECAVNIESDDLTEVFFAQRIEDIDPSQIPAFGFTQGVKLSYNSGPDATYLGLEDSDFAEIVNDNLYKTITGLTQGCDAVAAYGFTYTGGDGIHDIHMNSGYDDSDADENRPRQDGAIAFYFNMESGGQQKAFANWVFIKFDDQSIADE